MPLINCKHCHYKGAGSVHLHCVTCPHCGKKAMKLQDDPQPSYISDKFANCITFVALMMVSIAFDSAVVINNGWDWKILWVVPTVLFLAFWKVQTRTTPNKDGRFLIKRNFPL